MSALRLNDLPSALSVSFSFSHFLDACLAFEFSYRAFPDRSGVSCRKYHFFHFLLSAIGSALLSSVPICIIRMYIQFVCLRTERYGKWGQLVFSTALHEQSISSNTMQFVNIFRFKPNQQFSAAGFRPRESMSFLVFLFNLDINPLYELTA